jgi:hypothetical protein
MQMTLLSTVRNIHHLRQWNLTPHTGMTQIRDLESVQVCLKLHSVRLPLTMTAHGKRTFASQDTPAPTATQATRSIQVTQGNAAKRARAIGKWSKKMQEIQAYHMLLKDQPVLVQWRSSYLVRTKSLAMVMEL